MNRTEHQERYLGHETRWSEPRDVPEGLPWDELREVGGDA